MKTHQTAVVSAQLDGPGIEDRGTAEGDGDAVDHRALGGAVVEDDAVHLLAIRVGADEDPPAIRQVGPARCILSTDYGQKRNVAPAPGLRQFLELLLAEGISRGDIDVMAKVNPARLLSL